MPATEAEVRELYDRYGGVLFHRCRSILGNDEDAQDAVQETFARVIRHYDSFREDASPLTWMYRISTNHCLNQVRNRRGRERKHEDHAHDLGADRVAVQADEDPDKERILALLEDADEETRACVVHTYFDDCTREEVAQLVGLSVPTVRKRVNTFLDHARRALGVALTVLFLLWRWS